VRRLLIFNDSAHIFSVCFCDKFTHVRFDFAVWEPYFPRVDSIANFVQRDISAAFVRGMPVFGDICGKFLFGNVKYPRLLALLKSNWLR
jgi:hypothetical protein